MDEGTARDIASGLAHDLVTDLAPQELPIFPALSGAFVAQLRDRQQDRKHDEVLGFGIDATMTMITPVVLAVALEVVKHVAVQIADAGTREGGRAVGDVVRRLFRRTHSGPEKSPVPALDAAQLGQIRALAYAEARRLGLPKEQSAVLGDAIVGHLAIQLP